MWWLCQSVCAVEIIPEKKKKFRGKAAVTPAAAMIHTVRHHDLSAVVEVFSSYVRTFFLVHLNDSSSRINERFRGEGAPGR